jgi:hypothetical protein
VKHRGALLGLAMVASGLLLLIGLAGALLGSRTGVDGTAPRFVDPRTRDVRTDVHRVPRPTRVMIPTIGVDAPVVPLGLDDAGALEAPREFAQTGWWTGGSWPGERGPAVIAGHVDSRTGPAVFYRLGELRRGDPVIVERADGSRVDFRVEGSGRYPKAQFPTVAVYGPTAVPALRLITCSGTFDRASGHYLDNTVVYAARREDEDE